MQGGPGVLSTPHAATAGSLKPPRLLGSMMEMGAAVSSLHQALAAPQAGCKVLASEAGPSKPTAV